MAKQVVKRRNDDSFPPPPDMTGARRSPSAGHPGAGAVTQSGSPPTNEPQEELRELLRVFLAMREGAPDEDKRMRTADVLAALQAVRSAMAAERGTDVSQVPPPDLVRSRLMAFGQSLQGLREPDDGMPY